MIRESSKKGTLTSLLSFVKNHYTGLIVLIFIAFAVIQMYKFRAGGQGLRKEAKLKAASLEAITKENEKISNDIEYLKNPYNVLKEVRSHFNYRRQNEKLIVIIPETKSTSTEVLGDSSAKR